MDWKAIEGFEEYEVSRDGLVKSTKFSKERILKPGVRGKGYRFVVLCKNGIETKKAIHRLVAEAFVENSENKPYVNHKDENKDNNRASNLEWCDNQYNIEYSQAVSYDLIDPEGRAVTIFNVAKFIRDNNFTRSKLYDMLSERRQHYKGWRKKGGR